MFAADATATSAESGEKFFDGAGGGNFRICAGDAGEGVRIAAGDADFAVGDGEAFGFRIGARPHLAVAGFKSQGVGSKPFKIFEFAATGEARKDVVHAVENLTLGEVHQERYKIVSTLLNFNVVALGDTVNTEVELGPAGQGAGDFFAEKEVGSTAEDFDGFDRIVVGDGDDGHTEALAALVNGFGVVIGLAAEMANERRVAHPGGFGMDVKVAAHESIMAWGYEQSVKRSINVSECAHGTH